VDVQRIGDGLWRWTGFHPEWRKDVGCLYLEADDAVVLVDPLVPDDPDRFLEHLDRDVSRAGRPVHIALTIYWHARSATALAERYGATVWAPARSVGPVRRRTGLEVARIRAGGSMPGGLEPCDSGRSSELVYYLPTHKVLVAGDVLLGGPLRICPRSWLGKGGREAVSAALAPLLERPVELVLVSHGDPVLDGAHDQLAAALRAA
jgi:glyoxylase-like metal-dependent hydrolase (beta-lactamase superfamily II)